MIDLRSDTVTQPTEAMREAMARAPVGDDQFGEDPSINHLQERVAEMLGKEAALWVPTGTMANQAVLRALTRPGDDVVVAAGSHLVWSETGASGANAGVQFTQLGGDAGWFDADTLATAIKPTGHVILPPTSLVSVENTHNMAGGVVIGLDTLTALGGVAAEAGIASYMDGARLWNAAEATGRSPAELSGPFDVVWVAFSKALGAPGGSMIAADAATVASARRYRRMLGGAMRQAGIFAAAADYALDHHLDGIAVDHANAKAIAETLAGSDAIRLDAATVQSNIVVFHLADETADAARVVDRAGASGVGVFSIGPSALRAVTHRDVTTEECLEGARILVDAAES